MADLNQTTNQINWTQPHNIYDRCNLTRLQLLYWLGQNLRPESPIFSTILVFRILTDINSECFQKAFQATLEYNDALRTVIDEVDGIPQRRVITDFTYIMDFLDFSHETEPESTYKTWLQKRSENPLRLNESLFDAALIKVSNNDYVWFINQHHLITDASSAFLVFERLAKFYQQQMDGKSLLPTDFPQFEDYVEYEVSYRNSPQYNKAKAYWQNKLSPGPEPMKFFGRSAVKKTTQVEMVSFDLGPKLSQEIRSVANQKDVFTVSEDLSLYNLFVTLFFI